MLTEKQRNDFATYLANEIDLDADEAYMYVDGIDATRDSFDKYDPSSWRECETADEDVMADGTPVKVFAGVQASKGEQRYRLWVADFGDVRAIYQA